MGTLELVPLRWFFWNFDVIQKGVRVAEINLSWTREQGKLIVEGGAYLVYREGLVSGSFILEREGTILARPEKPSSMFRVFSVRHENRIYTLKAAGFYRRTFVLMEDW